MATDKPDSQPIRSATRPAHLLYVEPLAAEGRVVIAGPHPAIDVDDLTPGVTGSLIIAEFESLKEARSWAEGDPYYLEGVFARVEVKPLIPVIPSRPQ